MLIGNLSANYDENNNIITARGNTISQEQVNETSFRVKKTKAESLASKLNTPIPPLDEKNVDEVLKDLQSEADSLSIREKDNKQIRAEDTRLGYDEELFFAAGITGNTDIVSQILNQEDLEDQENLNALKTMDKANNKNIRVYEDAVTSGRSTELDRLEDNIAIAENLESKGLNINIDDKSDIFLKTLINKLESNPNDPSSHIEQSNGISSESSSKPTDKQQTNTLNTA